MSWIPSQSGFKKYPLDTGVTDNPALTQGQATIFNLSSIPEVEDGFANYLPVIALTIAGNVVQSGGTGTRILLDNFIRALIASIEVRDSFFGFPLRAAKFLGAYLPSIEFISGGYQNFSPRRAAFPAANGTYAFSITLGIPINYFGCNVDPMHTSQLAAAFKNATMVINVAASSVITGMSTGSSLTSLTAKAMAICVPEREIRLAPGIEWTTYTAPASSGEQFTLINFGNDSGFDGVQPGAGLLYASLLTNARGMGGAFAGNAITAFGAPFRGQRRTTHLEPFISEAWAAMDRGLVQGSVVDAAASQALTDYSGAPHLYQLGADVTGSLLDTTLVAFPIVSPGRSMQLSKVQRVDGNEPLTFGGTSSGTQTLLACQAKQWTQEKVAAYTEYLIGLKVPQKVLGAKSVKWEVKMADHQARVNPRKARYLPLVLRAA